MRFQLPVISIHTPAKGVTRAVEKSRCKEIISIHTPAKGVTFPKRNRY